MKKNVLVLALVCLLFSLESYSQTTTAFRKNYNQALFDLPGNIVEGVTPSTYVMAGTNLTFLPIYGTVTELSDTGAVNWSFRYSDASIGFQLNDIKKDAATSQYITCGGSESNAAVFMVLDAAGNVVIQKKFSIAEANSAWFNRVIKTSDGGYVAVGYVTGHDPDGAGAEIDFNPINYTDTNGDPQTEYIGSPLIVKLDASGNHVWHKVFRYYMTSAIPANRIYNDASFVDVVEVSDGYVAVGSYDVNNHLSATNSDGDDATPTDAIILKTTTAGAITYHKQVDNPSNSTSQSSKYLSAISTTSAGAILAAGGDNSRELIQKFAGAGGFSNTFSRLFTYSTSIFGTVTDPADVSQVYEVNGGTDIVTMAMYIKPLSFFSNSIHRVNSTATANVWAKRYDFNLISILPRGSKTSDNGYIAMAMTAGGANYDYHVIKTDPSGDTPASGCPAASFSPSAAAGPTTFSDPLYTSWSGTPGSNVITIVKSAISPTPSYVCTKVACVAPAAPTVGAVTQPTCSVTTGSVALSGLPASGTWTVTASPGGVTATGTGTTGTISGLAAGTTYTFTVQTVAGCPSVASGNAIINAAPTVPSAPTIGTITQPTCTVATGSVVLNGLPSSGTWTVTGSPSGTATGTGTTTTISGLTAGTTYTFTVSNGTCTSTSSLTAALTAQPTQPTVPVIGTITQPTCSVTTGSVALSGLPSSGTWTVTGSPSGTATGTGTTTTVTGLTAGTTYTFTVSNGSCSSSATINAVINAAPTVPTAPVIGTITQPTCTVATGSVALSGLPSSGTWTVTGSPSGTATGTGTTTTISGLTAGTTYTFTVSNGTCSSTTSLTAALTAAPTVPTTPVVGTITQPSCTVSTGSVALSGLPSSGTWTVTATPGGATATGTGTTGNITGLAAGTTYTFTVSNGTCSSAASTNAIINSVVGVPTTPIVGTVTQPTCSVATGSVALSGLPSSGTWTITGTPSGTATGSGTTTTVSGLAAGTYTFIVNDGTCNSTATTNVVINAQPATPTSPVIGTITQPTCSLATGSVALTGLPASGTWTVTGSPSGTATGTGTTTTVSGLSAGTYTFTVSDGTCSSTVSVNAVITSQPTTPIAPAVGTITQPSCTVATGDVALSGLPSSGTWTVTVTPGGATSTGTGTTTTITGLTAGNTYTFTVSDGTCTSAVSTNAVINAQPTVPSTPILGTVNQPSCTVATGDVAISGLPASGTWTITATPGGTTATGTGTTTTFSGLAGGSTYTFTVSDGTCTSVASTSVTINTFAGAPTAPLLGTLTQPTCTTTAGSVVLTGLPSTGTWTVTTNPGAVTTTGTGTSTTITGLTAGTTYTFTVDNGTCTSTASANAVVNAVPTPPTATAGSPLVLGCSPLTGTISASSTTGTATYSWSGPGIVTGGSNSTATVNAVGTYTVTVTDPATACTSTTTVAVTNNTTAPAVTAGGSLTLTCAASSGTISASSTTSGASFNWTGAGITSGGTTATPTVSAAGTYTVTVTDPSNGCTATTTISVSANNTAPNVTAGSSTPISCTTGLGTISASSTTTGATYSWSGTGIVSGGTTATPSVNAAGTYTVTVTDPSNGCTATAIVTAVNSPGPTANAGTDVTIVSGTSTTLTATGGGTYAWSTGETTSAITVTPTTTTDYCVTVTDGNGCSDSSCVRVTVDVICGELSVPNAFSPNGDNFNDKFKVKVNPECVIEIQLFVYDRWGEKVFEGTTPQAACVDGWDGTFNGKALDNAVFVYYLNITLSNSPDVIKQKGNVSLIR